MCAQTTRGTSRKPQGLKPRDPTLLSGGTTEVVPCYKTCLIPEVEGRIWFEFDL